ncbi:putative colanic acid biosynthesis acetyltransferase [Acuticoccus sp. I52.16.1]|uniref:putative colanic acid biosynthesis acetyltransferase n=1 Tax=Acuticoccus sp. I52.16.1 TaxID=2928472 RepID=UPI001FD16CA3|nr:putative colanic acid biosynthesis acetyltransferase [Acuticoccus sp. I52.16.1]UOM36755.1 putative colanic acid biosynthesis acetyltransferase [Acuticoccus sp. I52.16.1]
MTRTNGAPPSLDITANRRASKWTRSELAGRILWALAQPLFRLTPRPLWAVRTALLQAFGARVGHNVQIHPTVKIAIPWNLSIGDRAGIGDRAILYALGPITIGADATISQGAHLCAGTHDFRDAAMPLLKPPIIIGAGAWVCADAFVGPNVSVGELAVLGARSVAMRDVPAGAIAAGNPARVVGRRVMRAVEP